MNERIKTLMEANGLCVMATVFENHPHCSLMSYALDDERREIYLAMEKSTKKYANLVKNPAVSLLIDSREAAGPDRTGHTMALTIAGVVRIPSEERERQMIRARLLARHPRLSEIMDGGNAEIAVVSIRSFQLLDGIMDAYYETVD